MRDISSSRAVSVKTAHKGKLKDNLCVLSFVVMIWQRIYTQNQHFLKVISSKKDFLNHLKNLFKPIPQSKINKSEL